MTATITFTIQYAVIVKCRTTVIVNKLFRDNTILRQVLLLKIRNQLITKVKINNNVEVYSNFRS